MKAWVVTYQISKCIYKEVFVSDKIRSVKYKIATKHGCPLKMVKIIDSQVFLDNQTEE